MFEKIKRIHFIGIGGSGMSGIAEVLLTVGYQVSGSDLVDSSVVKYLRKLGADISIGHSAENIVKPHVVVVSSAIGEDNPEVIAAKKKNIPAIPRAEMLAEIMRLKYSVCVAGTHGKTTTTSMSGLVLSEAGLDPTIVIGGRLKNLKSNVRLGRGEFIVAEADESDGSFLYYNPSIAIVTNIDNDHMEYYGTVKCLKETFVKFLNKLPFYGFSIICGDDENVREIMPDLKRPFKSYGLNPDNDYSARSWQLYPEKTVYRAYAGDKELGEIVLPSSGKHNIMNSLAACALGLEIGIDFKLIKKALARYHGVGRRLEFTGEKNDIIFFDDYAHHPTAIDLSLRSLREIYPDRRILVVFQPHRYSRTQDLCSLFPGSMSEADRVLITEIYAAGECPIEGVDSELLVRAFAQREGVSQVKKADAAAHAASYLKPGDICLTLGAGDVHRIGNEIRSML
ncbi:MAG: UDP-N-acetylmuramate--L-alanine ligase [Elusimicrobia bacterium]|nr:UDP-N-acetylmuramate--L-alanine ligase [Elusimicrobiota bacterium]